MVTNLRRFEAGKVLGTPDGTPAPYYYIAQLYFEDADELQAAMGSPEGQAAGEPMWRPSPRAGRR
jgi:uncharacterized protein (TIGR02118 family)